MDGSFVLDSFETDFFCVGLYLFVFVVAVENFLRGIWHRVCGFLCFDVTSFQSLNFGQTTDQVFYLHNSAVFWNITRFTTPAVNQKLFSGLFFRIWKDTTSLLYSILLFFLKIQNQFSHRCVHLWLHINLLYPHWHFILLIAVINIWYFMLVRF